MGAFLRVEAAGMATTAAKWIDERWLPNLYFVFFFKLSARLKLWKALIRHFDDRRKRSFAAGNSHEFNNG